MSNWVEISQVLTAGGTLVLAVATFSSIRSSNRNARVAERALLASQRPVLVPSREDDPTENVRFVDGYVVPLKGHGGSAVVADGQIYLALALRNGGAGLAVILGWRVEPEFTKRREQPPGLEAFRDQSRDLYVPAGSTGFWQGALRDANDPDFGGLQTLIEAGERVMVDILYGDHDGGQRSIARFTLTSTLEDNHGRAEVVRYWYIDGGGPR